MRGYWWTRGQTILEMVARRRSSARLTDVGRYLRAKDIDVAVDRVTEAVDDWSGGTRIGECLAEFNRR